MARQVAALRQLRGPPRRHRQRPRAAGDGPPPVRRTAARRAPRLQCDLEPAARRALAKRSSERKDQAVVPAAPRAVDGPVWNHANTKHSSPRTSAAIACLTWWWVV